MELLRLRKLVRYNQLFLPFSTVINRWDYLLIVSVNLNIYSGVMFRSQLVRCRYRNLRRDFN